MKRIVKIFLHYLLGILGIILISCVPAIFSKVTSWSSSTYWEALKSILQRFSTQPNGKLVTKEAQKFFMSRWQILLPDHISTP